MSPRLSRMKHDRDTNPFPGLRPFRRDEAESLSAEQIDHIPAELENRLPDICVNGNNAWLVDPRIDNTELLFARKQMRPGYG